MNHTKYATLCYFNSKKPFFNYNTLKVWIRFNRHLHKSLSVKFNSSQNCYDGEKAEKISNVIAPDKQSLSGASSNQHIDNDSNSKDNDLVSNVLAGLKNFRERQKNSRSVFNKSSMEGKNLKDFIKTDTTSFDTQIEKIPYLQFINGNRQKVYLEIYGCQMNVNDAEIISAVLKKQNYLLVNRIEDTDIVLLITCSIRDGAEQKIWHKLQYLKSLKEKKYISKIGLLGCMAERLKHRIIEEEKIVDVIAGPDSYKDLPRLLAISNNHETAINVALSYDETYADVTPVRLNPDSKTAYVTIMRGCDNMCSYCIVPFTRGKERSRPLGSILDEVQQLSDQGVKEVTLLGQNVNSYRDLSEWKSYNKTTPTNLAKGFKTVYKNKVGGMRFCDLLDKVSLINPEMRIRFTSPHPKDFPDEVLHLISERSNICRQIHLPAQSGSSSVLTRMRRGYSREAYLELVDHIRSLIPNIAFSSDFIAGFCDESEEEFNETLTLLERVKYNSAFLFAYSMREKTTAHRRFTDNVDKKVKLDRLQRMIELYRSLAEKLNQSLIGHQQLVLVEGISKRSSKDLQGRNDGNTKVIFPGEPVPENNTSLSCKPIKTGDYVVVYICNANSQVLRGIPLYHSSIRDYV